MKFAKFFLLILPLALAACGPGYRWSKPGVTTELAAADYDRCRTLTEREVDRKYWSQREWLRFDRYAGRSRIPKNMPRSVYYALEEDRLRADQDFDRVRMMRVCMEGNGYELVPIEPPPPIPPKIG